MQLKYVVDCPLSSLSLETFITSYKYVIGHILDFTLKDRWYAFMIFCSSPFFWLSLVLIQKKNSSESILHCVPENNLADGCVVIEGAPVHGVQSCHQNCYTGHANSCVTDFVSCLKYTVCSSLLGVEETEHLLHIAV